MYQDPILTKLIEKLNLDGPAKLKNKYYIGDPIQVPESLLPVCFITKDTTTINPDSNIDDRHTTAVILNVVSKFTSELNQKAFVHSATSGLYEMCEARNADYSLKSGSLAYALRHNETLDSSANIFIDVDTDLVITYAISPPSRRGIFSAEAMVRTNIVSVVTNP